MDAALINELVLQFKKSNDNLLLVVIFSAINLVLLALEANVYLLFSATLPQIALGVGQIISEEVQNGTYMAIGFIIGAIIIGIYFLCWHFGKKKRGLIVLAFILFIVDSLILAGLAVTSESIADSLLDIVFHVWVLYYLFQGTLAWKKLKGISDDQFNNSLKNLTVTEEMILSQANQTTINEENKELADKEI